MLLYGLDFALRVHDDSCNLWTKHALLFAWQCFFAQPKEAQRLRKVASVVRLRAIAPQFVVAQPTALPRAQAEQEQELECPSPPDRRHRGKDQPTRQGLADPFGAPHGFLLGIVLNGMPGKKKPQPRQQFFNAIRDDKATKSLDTIRYCLRHGGVNIRAEDDNGHSAMQIAAVAGKLQVLEVLCDHARQSGQKDVIDIEDEEGRTPLMLAAAKGRVEAVKILSKAGASWTAKSEEGLTARDYAAKSGNSALVAIFDDGIAALLRAKEPVDDDDDDDDGDEEKRAKKWRLGGIDANKQAKKETAIHEARLKERDEVEATLGTAPEALWPEVKAVVESKGRELSIVRKEADLDPALWYCITLNSLRLKIESATLKTIPQDIKSLQALSSLIVSSCGLEELPDALGNLSKLRVLEAASNNLTALPQTLVNCPLEVLNLASNRINDVGIVEQMTTLVTLNLDRNELTALPVPAAEHMRTISAASNKISEIPPVIGKLQMLRELTLADNEIQELPAELAELSPKVVARCKGQRIEDGMSAGMNPSPHLVGLHLVRRYCRWWPCRATPSPTRGYVGSSIRTSPPW